MKKIVITGAIILMLLCLAVVNKSSYAESGSSALSESETKEAAVEAMDNNSVPPVTLETNTLYVKAGTSGHETFSTGEEKTIAHYIYWTDPNEVFGYFLMGYLKIEFDPTVVEPVSAQSGAFSTRISRQGPGWIIVDPWMWYPGESDPNFLAFSIIWRGKQAGTTGFSYSVTDSNGNHRGYFLTGTVHNMQQVPAVVEFSTQPPAAPSNLVATAVSSSQIDLSWQDNSDNEQGFIIEYKPSCHEPYVQIVAVNANMTNYSNLNLPPATLYFYRVKAYNETDISANSNETYDFTFTHIPTINELSQSLEQLYETGQIQNPGIYNSLYAKIRSENLGALENEINAQSGKFITLPAAETLINSIHNLAGYNSFRDSLPATIEFHVYSAYSCENTTTIAISDNESVNTTLSGIFTVQIYPTANPDIASLRIVNSSYQGTPMEHNGMNSGQLFFSQDTNNNSLGTLNLKTGQIHINEHVLATSSYLDLIGMSPVFLDVPQKGILTSFNLNECGWISVGEGVMPLYLPGWGWWKIIFLSR